MATLQQETLRTILGVPGRAHNVISWEGNGNAKAPYEIANQKWFSERRKYGAGELQVELRFDDNCRNGHSSFSITADYRERRITQSCGCLHEDIAAIFPELKPLIPWHLSATDGPMHYLANTVYHASDRDCYGNAAGDPDRFTNVVSFGINPIEYEITESFFKYLKHDASGYDFEIIDMTESKDGNLYHGFSVGGFDCRTWYAAPFKTSREAEHFVYALQHCTPVFSIVPTHWSKGKERELDSARLCAVWPEATDNELSAPKDELKRMLESRLPGLIARFRSTMVDACGFLWEGPK